MTAKDAGEAQWTMKSRDEFTISMKGSEFELVVKQDHIEVKRAGAALADEPAPAAEKILSDDIHEQPSASQWFVGGPRAGDIVEIRGVKFALAAYTIVESRFRDAQPTLSPEWGAVAIDGDHPGMIVRLDADAVQRAAKVGHVLTGVSSGR